MTTSVLDVRQNVRPRVCKVPEYTISDGDAAVELAAAAGLFLDDWQADILRHSLGIRPDGRWSAFEIGVIVPRQNGKGAIVEARELAGLFLFGERLIMHTAHEFKTALEAFLRIKSLIENTDDLRRRVRQIRTSNGEEGIELLDGARLRFVARSSGSGRGFSGDCVILDEAYALQPKELAALLPTMSARPNPQIWYTSTPPEDSAALLTSLRRRGNGDDSPRLAYFEYSAPLGSDLDDRDLWQQTNPALGIRIEEEFVAAERGALPDEEFGRERLGIWPPTAEEQWQVIGEGAWHDAEDPQSRVESPVAIGISMTADRSHTSIGIFGRRADGKRHCQLVEHGPGGKDWAVAWVVAAKKERKVCAVVIGAQDPARSFVPDFEAAGVEVLTPGTADMAGECGAFYDGICGTDKQARDIFHIGQGPLTAAVAGAVRKKSGDAWVWARLGVGVDISPVWSVTAGSYGFRITQQNIYDPLKSVLIGAG